MIELILITIIACIILIFAYIKIQYPFWNMMPMYHSYDILPRIYNNSYIVNTTHRANTKYYQSLDVETQIYNDLEMDTITNIKNLLHSNYIQDDKMLYEIDDKTLDAIYNSDGLCNYVSLYRTQQFSYIDKTLHIAKNDYIQGMIGSTRITFKILEGSRTATTRTTTSRTTIYNLHKVNHFCCHHNENDNKLINRKLLCSHFHNVLTHSRKENNEDNQISGFIFSKDIDSHKGLVPFINYTIRCYTMARIIPSKLKSGYFISELSKKNMHQVGEYIENQVDMTYQVLNNVYTLPNNPVYKIYILSYKTNIIGLYIFQHKKVYCERSHGYIMDCICSHNNLNNLLDIREPEEMKKNEIVFTIGFNEVITTLKKQDFSKIHIHNLGHNNQIIKHWISPDEQYQSYLYLYNIIVPNSPIQGDEYFSMS
jgi:hypothetical protein